MGFYSFRKSMWTATDADDASSPSVIGGAVSGNGRVDAADPASKLERDLIDHRKVCKAKPGNCPFDKQKVNEIQAMQNKDAEQAAQMGEEQNAAPTPSYAPPTKIYDGAFRQQCATAQKDLDAASDRCIGWQSSLDEINDVFLGGEKAIGEHGKKMGEEAYNLKFSKENFEKALQEYDAAPTQENGRKLDVARSVAEAAAMRMDMARKEYRTSTQERALAKLKSVVESDAGKTDDLFDGLGYASMLGDESEILDRPELKQRNAELQKALEKVRDRRNEQVELLRTRYKTVMDEVGDTDTDDDTDFYGLMRYGLGVLEDLSILNDEYETDKRYIETRLEDEFENGKEYTPAQRSQHAVKWQDAMSKNAEATMRLYAKDGNKDTARGAAIKALEAVSQASGVPMSEETRSMMFELHPKMVCTFVSSVRSMEYVEKDEAYCARDKIVMSKNEGWYNSTGTFFHEAGHAALHRFVGLHKRENRDELNANDHILSEITDTAESEASALFSSWYDGKSMYSLGNGIHNIEMTMAQKVSETIGNTLYGNKDDSYAKGAEDAEARAAIQDIICAVTHGAVGKGHSAAYFADNINAPLHEIVANITCLSVMRPALAKSLFPKTTRLVHGMVYGMTTEDENEGVQVL